MVRTQIQLPDPLYREVQRVAKSQDWSLAEVIRRGAEAVVRAYPPTKSLRDWQMPSPLQVKMLVTDPVALRDLVHVDQMDRPE
jgi:hypothetical protein